MKKLLAGLVVLGIVAGAMATPAFAKKQAGNSNADKLIAEFKKLDKNGDGKLSREEFVAGTETVGKGKKEMTPEQQFKSLDKDGDGFLSPTEFAARGGKKK